MDVEQAESVALFFKEGGSDKVYQAQLEQNDTGWLVNFQFGRRGTALTAGTKTKTPVTYAVAKKAYDKLVAEKTGKGYSLDPDGKTFQSLGADKVHSGLRTQQPTDISDADAEELIVDPAWVAQEKYDGRRRMLRKTGSQVEGTNREGILVALATDIANGIAALPVNTAVLDGEDMGDYVALFDVLELDGVDLSEKPLTARLELLAKLVPQNTKTVRVVDTAISAAAKRALLETVRAAKREGLVFKRRDSHYVPGKPASGGTWRKLKFYAQATCRVASHHATKSSIGIELLDGSGRWIGVGNVTVSATRPAVGTLVEIKYLYAYLGGSLFQPSYCGVRDDVQEHTCTTAQLKYKSDTDEG